MKKNELQEDKESVNILKNWVTAFDKAIETKEQIIQKVHNVFGDNELVFNQPDYIDIYCLITDFSFTIKTHTQHLHFKLTPYTGTNTMIEVDYDRTYNVNTLDNDTLNQYLAWLKEVLKEFDNLNLQNFKTKNKQLKETNDVIVQPWFTINNNKVHFKISDVSKEHAILKDRELIYNKNTTYKINLDQFKTNLKLIPMRYVESLTWILSNDPVNDLSIDLNTNTIRSLLNVDKIHNLTPDVLTYTPKTLKTNLTKLQDILTDTNKQLINNTYKNANKVWGDVSWPIENINTLNIDDIYKKINWLRMLDFELAQCELKDKKYAEVSDDLRYLLTTDYNNVDLNPLLAKKTLPTPTIDNQVWDKKDIIIDLNEKE